MPRIIVPLLYYFVLRKNGNNNISNNNNFKKLFQSYMNFVIAREPVILVFLIWFGMVKLYNQLMPIKLLKMSRLSNIFDNIINGLFNINL